MTTAQAITLAKNEIVRHKSGKLYKVYEVITQRITVGCERGDARYPNAVFQDGRTYGVAFNSNPLTDATLGVIGQRDGKNFGPLRNLKASACEQITEVR